MFVSLFGVWLWLYLNGLDIEDFCFIVDNKYFVSRRKNIWRVSEWLLFNANSAIFQLYHGQNKLISNEMMMRSALY